MDSVIVRAKVRRRTINFFNERPGKTFSFTEVYNVSTSTGASRETLQSVLNELMMNGTVQCTVVRRDDGTERAVYGLVAAAHTVS